MKFTSPSVVSPSTPEPAVPLTFNQVRAAERADRKSTRLNSSHLGISYAVFCLKKKSCGDPYDIHTRQERGAWRLSYISCLGQTHDIAVVQASGTLFRNKNFDPNKGKNSRSSEL